MDMDTMNGHVGHDEIMTSGHIKVFHLHLVLLAAVHVNTAAASVH